MTRSRVCPLCGNSFFLQVVGRKRKVKLRALLIRPEDVGESGGASGEQHERLGPVAPTKAEAQWVYEALKKDPEVVSLKRRLVAGVMVVVAGVAGLVVRHQNAGQQPEMNDPTAGSAGVTAAALDTPVAPESKVMVAEVRNPLEKGGATASPPGKPREQDARSALEEFLAAGTLEARLGWSRHPEWVRPLMERDAVGGRTGPIGFKALSAESQSGSGERVEFRLVLEGGSHRQVFVVQEAMGYRVDWESFARRSDSRFADLKNERPSQPKLLRVWARAGKRFDGLFADDNALTAVELREEPGDQGEVLNAYALKISEAGAEADFRLREAGDRDLPWTVLVRYPASAETADQVWLERVVEGSWLVEPPS